MPQHHVEVRVSRQAFLENIQAVRALVAPAKVCVVMKANAYGHGLEALRRAVEAGADSSQFAPIRSREGPRARAPVPLLV